MEDRGLTYICDNPQEDMRLNLELEAFDNIDKVSCTCRSPRNFTNASMLTRLLSNFRISFVTFIAIALLVRPPGIGLANAERLSEAELCRRGEYYEDYALEGGSKAGTYTKLHGVAKTFDDCVDLCCKDKNCKMALMLKHSCFRVDCKNGEPHRCKRIYAGGSRFKPKLFIRGEVEKPMKGMSLLNVSFCIDMGKRTLCFSY